MGHIAAIPSRALVVPIGIRGTQGIDGAQGPPGPGTGAGAWAPATAYTANQVVQAPDGSIVRRLSSGTSRATFDSTERALWVAVLATPGTLEADGLLGLPYAKAHETHAYTMLGQTRAWDNFVRPDATDLNGLLTPSRHVWETGNGGTNRMANIGHRLVPTGVTETGSTNGVGIAYLQDDRPIMSLAAEWVWDNTGASTGFQNMVLGLCKRRFSFGSIQLAYYAISQPGQPLIQWELFCVGNPTLYTPIASGPMSSFDLSGAAKYGASINRTGTNQITIIHPDGTPQEVNDTNVDPVTGRSLIDTYAGSKVGLQLRRNYLTDGALAFLSMATAEAA